jgi:hypothetical protein
MRRLLVAMLLLGATAAQADDALFYLGAGVTRSELTNISNSNLSFSDIHATSWKALAGFRPISYFAVEADYLNLGGETSTFFGNRTVHSDAKAFAGYAVGYLPVPLPFLDLFAKAGASRWKLDGSSAFNASDSQLFYFSTTGTAFAYGAGAQVHLGKIGARLEYENFNISHTNGAGILSLSAILALP